MVGEEETHFYIGSDNPRHENRETATNNNLLSETEVLDVNVPVSWPQISTLLLKFLSPAPLTHSALVEMVSTDMHRDLGSE